MIELSDIEILTREYADHYQQLAGDIDELESAIRVLKKKALPGIKRAAARAAGAKEKLKAAIEAAPQLFEKPRTRLFHGVKVGITKKKGRVEWDNEAKVVERIERLLPQDQVELLIRTEKSVLKPGVYDLTAADLKRLGITIVGDGDEVVVKVVDSDIEKMVDALLDDKEIADAA
jgi:acetolactate synthase small subunit